MTASRDQAPRDTKHEMVETVASQAWAPCVPSFVLGLAKEVNLLSTFPLPLVGGVGGYNHHDIGEEVEWRPPLLYANPSHMCVCGGLSSLD